MIPLIFVAAAGATALLLSGDDSDKKMHKIRDEDIPEEIKEAIKEKSLSEKIFCEKGEMWVEVDQRTISEDQIPAHILEKIRNGAIYVEDELEEDLTTSVRKVSDEYVREQAKKFNRPIKRGNF